jgi:NDP-sugar pyrophosphorylase family protein
MTRLRQGMFLCAGLSTRMRPLTDSIPKVLLPFGSQTILSWMSHYFAQQGIEQISMNLHHGANHVLDELASHDWPLDIHTFEEETLLGTGGGIKNMQASITDNHFFVMNCDVMTETILQDMLAFHQAKQALATLLVVPDPKQKYTPIHLHPNQQIDSILQTSSQQKRVGMFGGVTIFSRKIFHHMPLQSTFCMVRDLLEPLCQEGRIFGYPQEIPWWDTGEVELYHDAIKQLTANPLSWMRKS